MLCRVFHKTNIGPPLGHRYAPFVEEEWEGEDVLPGEKVEEKATAAEASKTEKVRSEFDSEICNDIYIC